METLLTTKKQEKQKSRLPTAFSLLYKDFKIQNHP